ncbi:MAG: hypothetical protein ABGZ24_12145, partial [Fuerstiella sp.]
NTALVQSLEPRCLLTTAFYESFEGGLGSEWTIQEVDSEARVSIRNLVGEGVVANTAAQQFSQNGNSKSLAFDSTRASGDSTKDLGIAILEIDLTGLTDAVMTFQHFEGGDNNDPLPDQHVTQTAGDGVAISRDGTNWFRLKDLSGADINRGGDGLWQLFEFALGREIDRINTDFSAGLAFNDDLALKFSQWDDRSLPFNGWAIDELRIEDEAETFTLDRPRGVYHRFNLATEDDDDYFFRAAVYGTPDGNTPIFVEVHGSSGDTSMGRMRRLNRFVSNPASGINSLIVVAPAFVENVEPGRFSTPGRFNTLAWNTTNDAAADVALLNSVEDIAATGIGNADQLLLWGFSAGGQFVGRFAAAHPYHTAATVVGGPASQILPNPEIPYPYGTAVSGTAPLPTGVELNTDQFLRSRIMYWVGQDDDDPNHSQLSRSPRIDSIQGIHRLERSVTQYHAMHEAAAARGLNERDGHGFGDDDLPGIYEFLTRQHDPGETSVRVHTSVVATKSTQMQQRFLPQNIRHVNAGDEFTVELWIEAPANQQHGVKSGSLELFFDTDVADVLSFNNGAFTTSATGVVDETAGRVRLLRGTTTATDAGIGNYVLFSQIQMKANAAISGDHR